MKEFKVGDRVRDVVDIQATGTVQSTTFRERDGKRLINVLFDGDREGFFWDEEDFELIPPDPVLSNPALAGEVRVTDPLTGGQKGQKQEQYSMIPVDPLAEVARVYGYGAQKYDRDNWRKGYAWSLSLDALLRHIEQFRRGESVDTESGRKHLAHAAFHLFTLMEYDSKGLGTDDRGDAPKERPKGTLRGMDG